MFGLGSCVEEFNFVFTYLAGLVMIRAKQASPFIVFQVAFSDTPLSFKRVDKPVFRL